MGILFLFLKLGPSTTLTWYDYTAAMFPVRLNLGGLITLTDRGLKATTELLETAAVFAVSFCGAQ